MKRASKHSPTFEPLERRRLLAANLSIEIDDYTLERPGDSVTRTIRVFNNGDEPARNALIRSSLSSQLDQAVWTRTTSKAKLLSPSDPITPDAADYVVRGDLGNLRWASADIVPIGDVNADGFTDFGMSQPTRGSSTLFRVVFGGESFDIALGSSQTTNLVKLVRGSGKFRNLGDINGDRIDDLALGDVVLFGSENFGSRGEIDVTNPNTDEGFLVDEGILFNVGDANADGLNDVVVVGEVTGLLWGGSDLGSDGVLSRDDVVVAETDATGIRLPTAEAHDRRFHIPVGGAAPAGDLNGDGHDDVAVFTGFNEVSVLLGRPDLATRAANSPFAFSIRGISKSAAFNALYGNYARPAGDVNGDGFDDLLIISEGSDCTSNCTASSKPGMEIEGGAYLVYGRADPVDIDLENPTENEVSRFWVKSPYLERRPAASAMDVNQDGTLDIVLTAAQREIVIYGGEKLRSYDFGRDQITELDGVTGFVSSVAPGQTAIYFHAETNSTTIDRLITTSDPPESTPRQFRAMTILDASSRFGPEDRVEVQGCGDIEELVHLPAGEALIYSVSGKLRADAAAMFVSTVAAAGQPEELLRDNLDGAEEAVALDVSVTANGPLHPGERAVIEFTVTNRGPENARSVSVEETISHGLIDVTWERAIDPFPSSVDIQAWDASLGPAFDSEDEELDVGHVRWGSSLGDVNGDGFDDIFVNRVGISWGGEFVAPNYTLTSSSIPFDGANRLGDINGDGFDDFFAVEVLGWREPRRHFIVPGRADLASSAAELNMIHVSAEAAFTFAGDLNGDGFDDMIAGNHVVFGAPAFGVDSPELLSLDPTNSMLVAVERPNERTAPLAAVGDVNGDGFDDITVTSIDAAYVLFGSAGLRNGIVNETMLEPHRIEFHPDQQYRLTAGFVSGLGQDINGDGLSDLVSNEAMVIFGAKDLDQQPIDFRTPDGNNGFAFFDDFDPWGTISTGDLNNDGFTDVIALGVIYFSGPEFGKRGVVSQSRLDSGTLRIRGVSHISVSSELRTASGFDFNGDGIHDLMIAEPGDIEDVYPPGQGSVSLLLGRQKSVQRGSGRVSDQVDVPKQATVTYVISGQVPEAAEPPSGHVTVAPGAAQIDLNPLTNRLGFSASLTGQPTLPGDLNQDGRVLFDDFLILANNLRKTAANSTEGDLNDDEAVTLADFLILAANFG